MTERIVISPGKATIEEQVQEAIAVYAEAPLTYNGCTEEMVLRTQRRGAILATLRWIQENRDTILQANNLIRKAEQDIDAETDADI